MSRIQVVMNSEQRREHISRLLSLIGLGDIVENRAGAYTSASLTNTPEEIKPLLIQRQEQLKQVLTLAGIDIYDPTENKKYNPDFNTKASMQEVFLFDTIRVLSNRFFTGHILFPSKGQGEESGTAWNYVRMPVMFFDRGIRASRMQPFRTIYLGYDDFEEQSSQFVQVFQMLKEYEPGLGFHNNTPVLLGFKKGQEVVDLEEAVHSDFPDLRFKYDGNAPLPKLRLENPEIFYELRKPL